jgi:hypothetical protein
MRSAFTKFTTRASFGRYSLAKVVLPAPFGPAIKRHRGPNFFRVLLVAMPHYSYCRKTRAVLREAGVSPRQRLLYAAM